MYIIGCLTINHSIYDCRCTIYLKKSILYNINEKDNYVALAKCLSFYPAILLGNY